jgi:hypothetical protein
MKSRHSSAVGALALLPSTVCSKGAGRPAHALSENLQQRVAAAGSSAPSYGVDKKDYVFFKYAKCDCIGYKQLRSLRRRGEACPEHGRRRKPSQLLLQVRSAMQAAVPDLGPVVLEACLLPGSSKPFDMWLPKWHIAVEVDGKQHFRRSMHSKAAQQQYQRDRAVDADCRAPFERGAVAG